MRRTGLLAAALLWQSSTIVHIGTVAEPQHLRYQRAVELTPASAGPACVLLDASLLAHTASAAHNDLRLYRAYPGRLAQAETPFLLTESGPEPVDATEGTVEHLVHTGDELHFDLRMPARAYSELQLRLRMHEFVGTVVVSGTGAHGEQEDLGTFSIFDLPREGLGRWTNLPMAETSDPVLHIVLRLRTPAGQPVASLPPALIEGVSVPPSRLRQTVYAPVTSTSTLVQTGFSTVAVLHVPEHVPVERITFQLAPEAAANFARQVLVRARPERNASADTEVIDAGLIQRVNMPSGDPRANAIHLDETSLDATLGATLASNALVRVVVLNKGLPPLPIRSVSLEMRERKICFLAVPGMDYTLRYGDALLAAPVYDASAVLQGQQAPVLAQLGPERRNPIWRPRKDGRPFFDRHPELFWVLVLACSGMMGASALQYVQHRGGTLRN